MFYRKLGKTIKGLILYAGIVTGVTVGAAIVGCLFLSNGHVEYLFKPADLFAFLWHKRAGLKITIIFVATLIFFFLAEDGFLDRKWIPRRLFKPSPFGAR